MRRGQWWAGSFVTPWWDRDTEESVMCASWRKDEEVCVFGGTRVIKDDENIIKRNLGRCSWSAIRQKSWQKDLMTLPLCRWEFYGRRQCVTFTWSESPHTLSSSRHRMRDSARSLLLIQLTSFLPGHLAPHQLIPHHEAISGHTATIIISW